MTHTWRDHAYAAMTALESATFWHQQRHAGEWLEDALSYVNQAIAEYASEAPRAAEGGEP